MQNDPDPAEDLVIILHKNKLAPRLYADLMTGGRRGHILKGFDFTAPTYRTVKARMLERYDVNACGEPMVEHVTVPGYSKPIPVHRLEFMSQVRKLFADPTLMEGSLWEYDRFSNSYGELNTGEWFKRAEEDMRKTVNDNLNKDVHCRHYVCPVILFDDSANADALGRLVVQPIIASISNICGDIQATLDPWFLLGMIPPYPKS